MSKDFKYSKEYQEAQQHEQWILDALADMLLDVQYAKLGNKAEARRETAFKILEAIKEASKQYFVKKYSKF